MPQATEFGVDRALITRSAPCVEGGFKGNEFGQQLALDPRSRQELVRQLIEEVELQIVAHRCACAVDKEDHLALIGQRGGASQRRQDPPDDVRSRSL